MTPNFDKLYRLIAEDDETYEDRLKKISDLKIYEPDQALMKKEDDERFAAERKKRMQKRILTHGPWDKNERARRVRVTQSARRAAANKVADKFGGERWIERAEREKEHKQRFFNRYRQKRDRNEMERLSRELQRLEHVDQGKR